MISGLLLPDHNARGGLIFGQGFLVAAGLTALADPYRYVGRFQGLVHDTGQVISDRVHRARRRPWGADGSAPGMATERQRGPATVVAGPR